MNKRLSKKQDFIINTFAKGLLNLFEGSAGDAKNYLKQHIKLLEEVFDYLETKKVKN